MKQKVPVSDGNVSTSAGISTCMVLPFTQSKSIITHTAHEISRMLISPYSHGIDQSGNRSFEISSPHLPEVTVAPLPNMDSISSWFGSLFVSINICAASPKTSPERNGSLFSRQVFSAADAKSPVIIT